jgi:hypothetical protein
VKRVLKMKKVVMKILTKRKESLGFGSLWILFKVKIEKEERFKEQ